MGAPDAQGGVGGSCEAPDEAALERLKIALVEQLTLSGVEPPPDIFD